MSYQQQDPEKDRAVAYTALVGFMAAMVLLYILCSGYFESTHEFPIPQPIPTEGSK